MQIHSRVNAAEFERLSSELDDCLDMLHANPKNQQAGERAQALCRRLDDAVALAEVLDTIALGWNDVPSWHHAGLFHARSRKMGKALKCYENALRLDPGNLKILIDAAKAATNVANFSLAMEYFDRLLGGRPPSVLPPDALRAYAHANIRSLHSPRSEEQKIREIMPYLQDDARGMHSLIRTAEQACLHDLVHELCLAFFAKWEAETLRPYGNNAQYRADTNVAQFRPSASLEQYRPDVCPPRFSPYDWVAWLRAITLMRDPSDLDRVADMALSDLDTLLLGDTLPLHYGVPDLHMARARILHLAGRDHRPALDRCLAVPGYPKGLDAVVSSSPFAEETFRRNYPSWRDRFKGKDVCVLASGPSLHALETHVDDIRSKEALRFVVFNDFRSAVDKVLSRAGCGIDAIGMVSSVSFVRNEAAVIEQMTSAARPFLMSMQTMIEGQARAEEILRCSDRLILANSHMALPPTPSNGLNFEFINSLSLVVSMLLTAEPRRIFLFGADGGRSRTGESVYYDGKRVHGAEENVSANDLYLDLLEREAALADKILEFQLPVAAEVYGVRMPEIYNVCPSSNHRLFKKIDIETAVSLLNEG